MRLSHRRETSRRGRWRALFVAATTGFVFFVVSPAAFAGGWVDGGDDLPCVDDETCLWIEGCTLDGSNNPVYPDHNGTVVGGGAHSYKGDTPATPTTPSTPTPTSKPSTTPTSPTSKPTTKPASGSGSGSGSSSGSGTKGGSGSGVSTGSGSSAKPDASSSADPSADASATEEAEETVVLPAPTLTVDGSSITVTWAEPDDDRTVDGYTVELLDGPSVEVDAATTSFTFTDLEAHRYRARVVAQFTDGTSETSPVSDRTKVGGADPRTVTGTLTVTGDLVAGGAVTITGAGFAGDVSGFQVEIHSDPIVLSEVATDADGGFVLEATVPETLEAGDHHVVVAYDGVEVGSTPVTVTEAAAAAPAEAASVTPSATSADRSQAGLLLLGALAAVGVAALVGHEITRRRRPVRATVAVPSGTADEVSALTA